MLASAKPAPVHAARMRQNGPQCIFIAWPCHSIPAHNFTFKPLFFPMPVSGAFVPGQCLAAAINPGASIPGHVWPLRARQSMPAKRQQSKKQKSPGLAGQSVSGALAGLRYSLGQIVRGTMAYRFRFPIHTRDQTICANAGPGFHPAANGRGRIYSPLQYMSVQY